jgi:hypothetical protein
MSTQDVPESNNPAERVIAKEIKVYQEKGKLFRVIHADGVWCSVNAYGNINLIFFSERHPIPTALCIGIDQNGHVVRELKEKREGKKDAWFRELEVDVVLSVGAAKAVEAALHDYIAVAEGKQK